MAEPLKYMYNEAFFDSFINEMASVYSKFDKDGFLKTVWNDAWKKMELKERMRHIAVSLQKYLPGDYSVQAEILVALIQDVRSKSDQDMIFEYMFVPDYIEVFGLDDYKTSIFAMEEITQFTSCEFAIRPFIIKYPQTMDQMMAWTGHDDYRVRRLASEGCRPRLPWAMALPAFKKDPQPILPILDKLKNDPTDFVYRSVANNLNDISKDHPELVVDICKAWKGTSKNTDWVVRHACRGLLKKAHPTALDLFGYSTTDDVEVTEFRLKNNSKAVAEGGELEFMFAIQNNSNEVKKLRLEYNIYFMKANGKQAPKIFKISEVVLNPGKSIGYSKRHSFRAITTRKYYVGAHKIALVLNGNEVAEEEFVYGM